MTRKLVYLTSIPRSSTVAPRSLVVGWLDGEAGAAPVRSAPNEQEGRPHQRAQMPIRHDASTYVPTTLERIEVCIHSRRSSRFRKSQDVGIILHLYGALVLTGREGAPHA
jgi:hypothetical protein